MRKFLMSLKKCLKFLVKYGVVEQMFDDKYPTLKKAWVKAVTELADKKEGRRFLTDPHSGSVFLRYKIHPLKGLSLFFRWLFQKPARNT